MGLLAAGVDHAMCRTRPSSPARAWRADWRRGNTERDSRAVRPRSAQGGRDRFVRRFTTATNPPAGEQDEEGESDEDEELNEVYAAAAPPPRRPAAPPPRRPAAPPPRRPAAPPPRRPAAPPPRRPAAAAPRARARAERRLCAPKQELRRWGRGGRWWCRRCRRRASGR